VRSVGCSMATVDLPGAHSPRKEELLLHGRNKGDPTDLRGSVTDDLDFMAKDVFGEPRTPLIINNRSTMGHIHRK